MASADSDNAKQRLVELRVGEVSLVDQPANEEEFLEILKSKDGDKHMGDQTQQGNEGNTDDQAGKTPAPPATDEGMAQLTKSIDELKELVSKAAAGKKPMEKQMSPETRSALMKIMGMIQSMMGGKSVQKDADGGETTETIETTDVEKAGQAQLTKTRMEALKAAAASVLKLIKEADPDTFKSLMSDVGNNDAGKMPKMVMAKSQDGAQAPEVKIDLTPLTSQLDDIKKSLEKQGERLDAVEKADARPKDLGAGDGDKPEEVKKSFWSGVL